MGEQFVKGHNAVAYGLIRTRHPLFAWQEFLQFYHYPTASPNGRNFEFFQAAIVGKRCYCLSQWRHVIGVYISGQRGGYFGIFRSQRLRNFCKI